MIPLAVHERDPHPVLYDAASVLLLHLATGEPWIADYIRFEICLMREAGFGLDLSQCAATGSREALRYVSPKSGCAVSEDAGRPYHDKLLPLPAFLIDEQACSKEGGALLDGFRLTGYFLTHWLLAPIGRNLPDARGRLLRLLEPQPA
jgi:DNA repair protein RecO (recombination protein O)